VPRTAAADVHAVLDLLEARSIPVWVAGGWGIDALVGRQTRDHADLDIAVPADREAETLASLEGAGFVVTTDWRPTRVALTHPTGAEVDVHPVVVESDGTGVLSGLHGEEFRYPAADLVTGSIGDRPVTCISAALQVRFHSGYEPTPQDAADLAVLAEATGVDLR
jgi:lincosamide nucleotidyltransferase A/C/D/E